MQIKNFKPVDHFVRATVYGSSWVWKTVFWWTAPKPIFASAENGLLSIVSTLWYSPDFVEIKTIDDLQELYKFLKDWSHDYQTLVIDSMTEINEKIKEWIEKKIWKRMQIQDRGDLSAKVKWIIRWIQDLPMNVILICQEKISTDDDGHVINVKPSLNWKNADEIAYLMDIVAYMYIDWQWNRTITTKPNPKIVSKDRTWLLQSDVSLNFSDRVVAMQWLVTWSSEVVHDVPKAEAPKKEEPKKPKKETPPAPIPPTEKKIAASDKLSAMTAFAAYSTKANPWIDKKEMFAALVADRFNWKLIDDLTEAEWKALVWLVQEITKNYDEQTASQAVVDDAIADEVITEEEAEVQPGDAVYMNDQWWIEKAQPAEETTAPKQETMQDVYEGLPF